ncbi:MFS transporter [Variovorax sp. ZS18.2.2]|uniref:MFS transporter n=1 Tax=Variovorax sp. ZS18.2.2 TaxID=2971255 RepID=UPI0021510717|nr:MFS transporter [Variovorax sp. ZS18.2.2]MCR6480510.1 MFS transporter [Variovorax sp. ZS18.2.2]
MTTTFAVPHLQSDVRWALPSRARTITAVTIGNALEFFDFTVYSFYAILIGKLFFPVSSTEGQLLLSIATFGVGFLARPLGGIFIGQYADRRGRKAAMTLTIMLMALGCAMIALAPTYAQIGLAAPLIIVVARLLQGFSAGGESGAAVTLLMENGTPRNRGFLTSWFIASQGLGIVIGAGIAVWLANILSPAALESWGWRIPFALGVLIAPVGFYIRRQLHETLVSREATTGAAPHAAAIAKPDVDRPSPLRQLVKSHKLDTLRGILLIMGTAVSAYLILLYMPTYAIRELGLPANSALFASVLSAAVTFVLGPIVGMMADTWGRKPLIVVGRVASVILVYPCFLWLNAAPSVANLLIAVFALSVLYTLHAVPTLTMLPEMLPKAVRATITSVSAGVGISVFGGTAQLIAVWLIGATGNKLAPALYLIVALIVSSWPLRHLVDQTGRRIDD